MFGSSDSHTDQLHPHTVRAAFLVTECANRFLAALDANQRGTATFPFVTDERMNWHFTRFRPGRNQPPATYSPKIGTP